MNKPKLKCLIALLGIFQGIVLLLLAIFIPTFSETTFTLLLTFGGILIAFGGIAYTIYYQGVQTITQLKAKELPILAHWTYLPIQIDSIQTALIEEKHSSLSIIILSTFLLLLIDAGFILSNNPVYLFFCILAGILIILLCCIACFAIHVYYTHKLTHPMEAIISENCIYFSGELYGLSRSFYLLEDVIVLEGTTISLQFIYGSPGTPYDPIHILTLPIPIEDLEIALKVKDHFTNLLK